MSTTRRPLIGIFGAGKSGIAIARLALDAGYTVMIASSGTAEDTDQLLRFVAPGAVATSTRDLPAQVDVLVLAVPLRRFRELPLDALGGRVVIDVMNYWPPIDGVMAPFADAGQPSSVVVRNALPRAVRLVKAFNHLGYHQMEDLRRPGDATDRTALALAGDDRTALEIIARFVDDLGFDPVPAGPLTTSDRLEPGGPIFGKQLDAPDMRKTLQIDNSENAA